MAAPVRHLVLIVLAILGFSACSSGNYQDVLRTLLEKERLVEDTRVNLLLAAEAEKNAVLSSTEEAARTYADQCRSAMGEAKRGLARLTMLAANTHDRKEAEVLARLTADFGKLETVDATILGMAGRNTNLRAAMLSRTKAAQATGRVREALASIIDGSNCQAAVEALRVVTASLAILSLHAQHIDEASNAAMDTLEASINQENGQAEAGLRQLAGIVPPALAKAVDDARLAYADLWNITQEVLKLSRENSNINALALTMGRQRQLVATALDDLSALHALVASKDFKATR